MEVEETEDTQEGMEGEGTEGDPQPKKHKVRGKDCVPRPSKEPSTEEGKLLIEPNGVE
jgi:hypothetical protein